MSGHSKWSTIKHKKGAADAKRGKIFTKLIKEITVAARMGGGDVDSNPRLRQAVDKAKANSMPRDNIDRAVKKGTGELEGETIEEMTYEGYGPGGVAIMVQVATDNKNRTVGEVRHIFSRNNGNLAENGAVSWMFERRGYISVAKASWEEDRMMELALEAGAEDIKSEDESFFEIYTAPTELYLVKLALEEKGVVCEEVTSGLFPKTMTEVAGKEAQQAMRLIDALEDHDDVTEVSTNFEPPDELLE